MGRLARVALFTLAVCLLCSPAFARSWQITEFADNIVIQQDGTASVQERITLQFEGEWHGIHRTIPVEYPGPNGTNYTLFLDDISVSDAEGRKLKLNALRPSYSFRRRPPARFARRLLPECMARSRRMLLRRWMALR